LAAGADSVVLSHFLSFDFSRFRSKHESNGLCCDLFAAIQHSYENKKQLELFNPPRVRQDGAPARPFPIASSLVRILGQSPRARSA
jgi:hypothetical protein